MSTAITRKSVLQVDGGANGGVVWTLTNVMDYEECERIIAASENVGFESMERVRLQCVSVF